MRRLFSRLEELFDLSIVSDIALGNRTPSEIQSFQIRERASSDLAAAQQKLETALVEMSTKDAQRRREIEVEMERRFQARMSELESKAAAERDEISMWRKALETELEQKRSEHEKKVAEYETREARAVRRSMQKRLEEVLKETEEVTLSDGVTKNRRRTELSIWGLIGLSIALSAFTGYLLFGNAFEWRYAIPFASSIFIVWGTLSYYIRWNDRWAKEHAAAEMLSRRYRADAVRANWLAEWVSEAFENDSSTPLPPDLLAAFTRNLFSDPSMPPEALHPLERLIDQAKSLEFGKDNVKVRVASEK